MSIEKHLTSIADKVDDNIRNSFIELKDLFIEVSNRSQIRSNGENAIDNVLSHIHKNSSLNKEEKNAVHEAIFIIMRSVEKPDKEDNPEVDKPKDKFDGTDGIDDKLVNTFSDIYEQIQLIKKYILKGIKLVEEARIEIVNNPHLAPEQIKERYKYLALLSASVEKPDKDDNPEVDKPKGND